MRTHDEEFEATSGKWKTQHARTAFVAAFTNFKKPDWMLSFEFRKPPYSGVRAMATALVEGDYAHIKVLPSDNAVHNFWETYPDADVVAVSVTSELRPEEIRERLFSTMLNLMD